ncbi:DNA/RNA non-specific endonuclease [Vibrio lentus]|nr:DNA/RNA non-specific endonuclease [Vibrio lentus]MDH5928008.1 DNA/RNA non-specific endonuclease [Vibrio lentus]
MQAKDLKQGAWKNLEEAVRGTVGFRESLYIITGTLYRNEMDALPKADEVHAYPRITTKLCTMERQFSGLYDEPTHNQRY